MTSGHQSDNIGDASFLGLSCPTGKFSDCNPYVPDSPVPFSCEGVLIFSNTQSTCGSMCESNTKPFSSSGRRGWTRSFISNDTPGGTGDHEHYFQFQGNSNLDKLQVYDSSGTAYSNCVKKAIFVRERETGIPWWVSKNKFTILFSDNQSNFRSMEGSKIATYQYALKPDYG